MGDEDPEFGAGGAYLLADHHDVENGILVDATLPRIASFVVGVDGNGDAVVDQANPADCHEPFAFPASATSIEVSPACAAPAGGGWWVFVSPPNAAGHVQT